MGLVLSLAALVLMVGSGQLFYAAATVEKCNPSAPGTICLLETWEVDALWGGGMLIAGLLVAALDAFAWRAMFRTIRERQEGKRVINLDP
jgi:hypothetical protein